MKEKDNIVLVGDIHGEYGKLRYDINRLHQDAHIIHVGDFGMGFHKPNYYRMELTDISRSLTKTNSHLYVIRGNHDDPEYFKQTNNPFDLSNITLLEDYAELNLLDKSILLVGGAVSVDRYRREKDKTWWVDETFKLKLEDQFPYKDRQYDLVVTHTRPGVCGAFKGFDDIAFYCEKDPELKKDLIEESQQVDYLYEKTKPKDWIYGHFHKTLITEHENTAFRCLNIHEHYQYFVLTNAESTL